MVKRMTPSNNPFYNEKFSNLAARGFLFDSTPKFSVARNSTPPKQTHLALPPLKKQNLGLIGPTRSHLPRIGADSRFVEKN